MFPMMVKIGMLCLLPGTMAPEERVPVYGAKGQSFVLTLERKLKVTSSVIWKFNGNKAAEWFEGDEKPTYFGIFNSTSTLDIKTGALNISNMQTAFSGDYLAEVNDKDSAQTLNLRVVDAVHVYGLKGQSINLQPDVPSVLVESAQWILNDRVVANWDEGVSETSHPSLLLDNESFSLTISFLQKNYTGLYRFTVNDHKTRVSYQLLLTDKVLKLVMKKECISTSCTLRCTEEDNEDSQVSWADNKGRKKSGPVLVVEKSEQLDGIYNCSSNTGSWNSISEKELFGDFSIEGDNDDDDTGFNHKILGAVIGAVSGALLVGILIGVCLIYRGHRQENGDAQEHVGENIEMLPQPGGNEDGVPDLVQVEVV